LRPWVSATAATEAPGCWQSEMTWRLRSGAWRRRVRFVGVLCIVSTYLLGGHYPHASGLGSQDAFTGRIPRMHQRHSAGLHHPERSLAASLSTGMPQVSLRFLPRPNHALKPPEGLRLRVYMFGSH